MHTIALWNSYSALHCLLFEQELHSVHGIFIVCGAKWVRFIIAISLSLLQSMVYLIAVRCARTCIQSIHSTWNQNHIHFQIVNFNSAVKIKPVAYWTALCILEQILIILLYLCVESYCLNQLTIYNLIIKSRVCKI